MSGAVSDALTFPTLDQIDAIHGAAVISALESYKVFRAAGHSQDAFKGLLQSSIEADDGKQITYAEYYARSFDGKVYPDDSDSALSFLAGLNDGTIISAGMHASSYHSLAFSLIYQILFNAFHATREDDSFPRFTEYEQILGLMAGDYFTSEKLVFRDVKGAALLAKVSKARAAIRLIPSWNPEELGARLEIEKGRAIIKLHELNRAVQPSNWSKPSSPSELAKRFEMSWDALKSLIDSGKIRAQKLGIRWYRIHVDDMPT